MHMLRLVYNDDTDRPKKWRSTFPKPQLETQTLKPEIEGQEEISQDIVETLFEQTQE